MFARESVSSWLIPARNKLRTLPLPRFLSPIETRRHLLLSFLILCGAALAIGIVIDLQRGIGAPSTISDLAAHMGIGALAGVSEELVFRGIPKRYLGNGGLVIGTICWVVLHQFYAPVTTIYRLPSDILLGVFYIKLWRGRLWWLALIIHPLWNVAVIVGWQLARMYIS